MWIKVKDRMPKSGQCVILYSPDGRVAEGAWNGKKKLFKQWRWNAFLKNVTHWMPLPDPPDPLI